MTSEQQRVAATIFLGFLSRVRQMTVQMGLAPVRNDSHCYGDLRSSQESPRWPAQVEVAAQEVLLFELTWRQQLLMPLLWIAIL